MGGSKAIASVIQVLYPPSFRTKVVSGAGWKKRSTVASFHYTSESSTVLAARSQQQKVKYRKKYARLVRIIGEDKLPDFQRGDIG